MVSIFPGNCQNGCFALSQSRRRKQNLVEFTGNTKALASLSCLSISTSALRIAATRHTPTSSLGQSAHPLSLV